MGLRILFLTALFFGPLVQRADAQDVSANATRPSASDNAYLTAPGYIEIETGAAIMEDFWSIPTLLKFTPANRIELGFIMSGVVNHFDFPGNSETEIGDPGVQVKAQVATPKWGALSMVGRVDFPDGLDPRYTGYGVISYLAPAFQLDATAGLSLFDDGSEYDTAFQYAAAVSPKLDSEFGVYAEIFGELSAVADPVSVDFGISWGRHPRFVPDLAVAFGLNDDAPDWQFQFGLTATLLKVID